MKFYIISCMSGIFSLTYTTVGEDYNSVFYREMQALCKRYNNSIDSITVKEITQCEGYKVVLEKIDLDSLGLPVVFGREGK